MRWEREGGREGGREKRGKKPTQLNSYMAIMGNQRKFIIEMKFMRFEKSIEDLE